MRIKTLARGLTLFVALAVALTVMAAPAVAAEPKAIASIKAAHRTVIAGTTEAPFEITVTNVPDPTFGATSASPNINLVHIYPPQGHFTGLPTVQAPAGWTGKLTSENTFLFFTTTDPLPVGGGAAFTVSASVSRPIVDITRKWSVKVSGNMGDTLNEATADPQPSASNPTGEGDAALKTTIKVLQVLATRLSAPLGATDNSVTSGQTVSVTLDVTNHGGGTLNVVPNVTFSPATNSTATASLIRSASCPDGSAAFPARQMTTQTSTTFTCRVKYERTGTTGNGNITTTGRATGTPTSGSGSAVALTSSAPVVVMTAAVFSYVSQSLQPTDVRPGGAFIFRLSLEKTGEVSVNLNKTLTTLTFGPSEAPTKFKATLNNPSAVPAGGTSASPTPVLLEFISTTVPADMPANDGTGKREYTPVLTVSGTDQNDFGVSTKPAISDKILVDALGPVINLNRPVPPPSRVLGEDPAATNNALVNFSGTIQDRNSACGACPIVSAVVRQYTATQVPIAGADIPVTIANNQGNLSGTYDKTYHATAFFMSLVVVGADPGGNTTTATSPLIPVDNVLPTIAAALTGTDVQLDENGETRINRLITVRVSEPLAAAMNAGDWVVAGHRVVSAEPQPSRGRFTEVRLTVDPELGRNEEPNVTYQPTAGSRANDRVGLLLANTTIKALDRIVPRLPEVLTISGMERQENDNGDEQFFTNDDTPAIALEVDPGDQVTVYEDCVAGGGTTCPAGSVQGELDAGDTARCSVTADPGETEVTCLATSFGTASRDVTLFARSIDARDNVGPAADELLTLDFIRPVISAVQTLVADIQVTFSETLSKITGREHALDWWIDAQDGTFATKYNPARVEGGPGKKTRTLRDGGWNQDGISLTQVRYKFELDTPRGGTRYSDRAGNELLDQTVPMGA